MYPENCKNINTLTKKQQEALLEIIQEEGLKQYQVEVLDNHEKGNNFMGTIIKIKIKGVNQENENVIKDLVLKIATTDFHVRNIVPISLFYKLEILYYTKILPAMETLQQSYINDDTKFTFVKCYKVHSEECQEFLIMDDVTVNGYTLQPRWQNLDIDHIRVAVKNIAYLHSLSFALQKYQQKLYNEFIKSLDNGKYYVEKVGFFIKLTLAQTEKYNDNEANKTFLKEFIKIAEEKVIECLNPSYSEPYNVITHGDCWQNNIMFKHQDGSPVSGVFLDWQLGKYCSPLVDLLHFVFSASEQSVRLAHYEDLIHLYYTTLNTQLGKFNCHVQDIYPHTVYRKHITLLAPYALVYSIISANLLIREDDNLPEVEKMLEDGIIHEEVMEYGSAKSITEFNRRVNGIFNDFRRLGYINGETINMFP